MFESREGLLVEAPTAEAVGASAALAHLDEVLAQAVRAAEASAACARWTAGERAGALARLDRVAGVLATARGHLLVAERDSAAGVAEGDRDLVAARARVTRTGLGEARREFRQAQTLAELPAVARAVAAGRVPLPHLDALGRAAADAGERATAALASPEGQDRLVRMAERLSVREFAGAVSRLVASYEPEVLERGLAAQRSARFLVLSRQPDGVHLRGRLDVVAGAALRAALDAVGAAPDADRDKTQADADALVAVAERSMSGMAGVPVRGGGGGRRGAPAVPGARVSGVAGRPLVSVLVPVETFVALKEARRRAEAACEEPVPRSAGDGAAAGRASTVGRRSAAGGGSAPATLEDGTPLPVSEVARLLCDAEIGRVVVDARSVPLDLGRTSRRFSAAQRRAVIIRDRVCAWNGCEVPAAYGELHHIRWWDRDGGPSDLDNAVLLCTHHHHVVHQLDLSIERATCAGGGGGDGPVRYVFRRAAGERRGRVVSAPVGAPAEAAA